MNNHRAWRIAAVLACMVALAACGGGVDREDPVEEARGEAPDPQLVSASRLVSAVITAEPDLPAGEPGELSVIAVGDLDIPEFGWPGIPVVLRNNFEHAVIVDQVSAVVRSGGTLAATGSDERSYPSLVQPGEIAFGYVELGDLADAVAYDVEVTATAIRPDEVRSLTTLVPLEIPELVISEEQLTGLLAVADGDAAGIDSVGSVQIRVMCIGADGQPGETEFTNADQSTFPVTATGSFTVAVRSPGCSGAWIASAFAYKMS